MSQVIESLKNAVGAASIVTDPEIVSGYLTDWTGRFRGEALCVARPRTSQDVKSLVEIALRTGTPVVPQGGNTGLVGGAIPARGGIIVSTERMKEIVIAADSQVAKVGAGVTLAELNESAKRYDLRFAVDLASRDSATIGGMVSTNAGGIHLVRYGGTRQQLLGIEAVLGSGQIISRMEGLHKDNSGYDWPSILCGSEGTLGVITGVAARLIPVPRHRSVALVSVATLSGALRLMADVRRSISEIDAIEFMSRSGLELVRQLEVQSWPLEGEIPPHALLVEVEGNEVRVDELAEFLSHHKEAVDAALAYDSRADGLWFWREEHTVAISRAGVPHKLDVSIPIPEIPKFVDRITEILSVEHPLVKAVLFGHLADGNVHVNLLDVPDGEHEIDNQILSVAASFGGSISAEHGVGRAKVNALHLTRSPEDLDAMASLKRALDPGQVLNPGVILDLDRWRQS